jgi:flagellar biosynthesis protein FlhF
VILNSRKVRKKGLQHVFSKPLLEVTVAYDPAKLPMAKKLGQSGGRAYSPPKQDERAALKDEREALKSAEEKVQKAVELNREQIANLDKRIDSLDEILNNFINKFAFVKREITYDYSNDVEDMLVRLIENQVAEELAHSLAKETEQILQKQQGSHASEAMEHLILEKLGLPDPIQPKKFNQKVVLVMGPTGVGKTTSIVKLAANFSVKQKKKVGIINTDTYRIAAQ